MAQPGRADPRDHLHRGLRRARHAHVGQPADRDPARSAAGELLADQELWYELIHPEDVERVRAEELRVFEAAEEFDIEYRMVSRDGRVIWVRDRTRSCATPTARPLSTQGVLMDITSQRRPRTRCARSATARRATSTSQGRSSSGRRRGRIALVNRAGRELLGYRHEELIGQDAFNFLCPPEAAERRARPTARSPSAGVIRASPARARRN